MNQEIMQMEVHPIKTDQDGAVEFSQGLMIWQQDPPPDHRADASDDNSELIDLL